MTDYKDEKGRWDWWNEDKDDVKEKPSSGSKGYTSGYSGPYGYSSGGRRSYDSKKGSLSDFWGGRFGGFKSWFGSSGTKSNEIRYVETLNSVERCARIVHGKEFGFTWNKEDTNDGTVLLDIKPIKEKRTDWDEAQNVDAVVGGALGEAGMKAHGYKMLAHEINHALLRHRLNAPQEVCETTARVVNWVAGRDKVLDSFPGYSGYFGRNRDFYQTPTSAAELQTQLASLPEDSLTRAAMTAAWNLTAPDEARIAATPEIDEVEKALAKASEDPRNGFRPVTEALKRFKVTPQEEDANGKKGKEVAKAAAKAMGMEGDAKEAMDSEEAESIMAKAEKELQKEDNSKLMIPPGFSRIHLMSVWQRGAADSINGWLRSQIERSYHKTRSQVRPLVEKTRAALSFRNERVTMDELGLRRGMLDENALADPFMGRVNVFKRQEIQTAPSVAFGILVDESGSMMGHRAEMARQCAVLLHEATRGLSGVAVSIWGHTGNCNPNGDGAVALRYIERGQGDATFLGAIMGRANNFDGFAIAYAVKQMQEQTPASENKILLVLCDGYPRGTGYGGSPAMNHVAQIVKHARKRGIDVYGLGMGNGLDDRGMTHQFGSKGYRIVDDVAQLPKVLGDILKKALKEGVVGT